MTRREFDLTGDAFEEARDRDDRAPTTAESVAVFDEAQLARELQRALEIVPSNTTVAVSRGSGAAVAFVGRPYDAPSVVPDDRRHPPHVNTAPPNAPTTPPNAPTTPSTPIEGVAVQLALAEVYADPKDNISRGGRAWLPTDRDVIEMAHAIETEGLIQPPEVRKLIVPIPRETPVRMSREWAGKFHESQYGVARGERIFPDVTIIHYAYRVSSGFCRFAALQLIESRGGRPWATFLRVQESDVDARRAKIRNLRENLQRIDPSEYNLALIFAELSHEGQTSEQIAKSTGARLARVDQLVLIATRLPPTLLDVFRQSPTPEVRRALASIAVIDAGSIEASHAAMLDEWARLQQGDLTAEELRKQRERSGGRSFGAGTGQGPVWYRNRLAQTRSMLREAGGWHDPQSNVVRELTADQRALADELLRWLTDPRNLRNPLR